MNHPFGIDSDASMVWLLVVADEEEEATVLAQLSALEGALGGVVLPVLDQGTLVERVVAALKQAGTSVRVERASSRAIHDDQSSSHEPRLNLRFHHSRPEAVLVAGRVDPACQRLAAGLCGTEPVPLEADPVHSDVDDVSSALVLLDPRSVNTAEVLLALSALADSIKQIGIIYSLDPLETRFALLKALAIDSLPGPDEMILFTMQYPPDRAVGAPDCFSDPSDPEAAARLYQPWDLLLLSGHTNPFDAAFGIDKALCARAGTLHELADNQAFPCFASGACFRQPRMHREIEDTRGLMSLRDVKATVVALVGCHTVALGDSWFDPSVTLAYQCQQSDALAAFVTSGISLERLELNFLMMALLSEGKSFGEVAREVNRVRLELHGHATSLPKYLGPLLLLGNPSIRFAGIGPIKREARWTSESAFEIELDGIEIRPDRGAFVRVEMPANASAFFQLQTAPEALWCRGVLYPRGEIDTLYLWLGLPAGLNPRLEGILHIQIGVDQSTHIWGALLSYVRQLSYWMVTLDYFHSNGSIGSSCAEKLAATLQILPAAARSLSETANLIRSRPGILVDRRQMPLLEEAVLAQAGSIAQTMHECLVEICCTFGTMHSGGWENSFERIGESGPLESCACGTGPLSGQRSRFVGMASPERVEYQCARCGPVGEDDGRRLLTVTRAPANVERGGQLRCKCICQAPVDEKVQFLVSLMLEGLYEGVRVVGEAEYLTVDAGGCVEIEVKVEIPNFVRPGVYPVAVVGVVNGASCIVRWMIHVRLSDSHQVAKDQEVG